MYLVGVSFAITGIELGIARPLYVILSIPMGAGERRRMPGAHGPTREVIRDSVDFAPGRGHGRRRARRAADEVGGGGGGRGKQRERRT